MSAGHETSQAALALRLLLGDARESSAAAAGIEWDEMLRAARRNFVLVRLSARLRELGLLTPTRFEKAAADERRRAELMFGVIRQVSRACEKRGVAHIFAKSFQHYPDMGSDIDLFVASRSPAVDEIILDGTPAAAVGRDLRSRMSGVAAYRVGNGGEFVLEIHRGRIGFIGEQGALINQFIGNGGRAEVGGSEFLLPSTEDLLILHGMQRVYRHGFIRLCDVLSTTSLVNRSDLNWDYVFRTSARLGTLYGLRSYMTYLGQIHREILRRELLPPELKKMLAAGSCGRGKFRSGVFVFPRARVASRIYLGKVRAALRARNWDGVSRLSLMPFVAAATLTRKLAPRASTSQ
ncbi:MAG: nucleotidyltransferase family protein [Pyrinomonadaceae bacterium]